MVVLMDQKYGRNGEYKKFSNFGRDTWK
jgi:hypothetical protein